MTTHAIPRNSSGGNALRWFAAAIIATLCSINALAQAPVAAPPPAAGAALSPEVLEKLVGPFALYPDDLVALILPAATFPTQVVQADRFLEKRKADPKLPIDEKWDDSVKALINYPVVIKTMSTDLDWTTDVGEAVIANQSAVLEAVQAFRRKAQAAGHLKTDAKTQVVVEQEIIKIEPTDPQVIYVPQYNPATVVVYSTVPAYAYYPYGYPSYYYPYAPGAALATGLIWGAAIGAAWGGGRYVSHYGGGGNNTININRGNNNINTGNINRGNVGGGNRVSTGDVSRANLGGGGRVNTGDVNRGNFSGGNRPSTGDVNRGNMGGGNSQFGASNRPAQNNASFSSNPSGRAGYDRGAGAAQGGGSAFGGSASGSRANMDSSRGASSRSSMGASASPRSSGGFSGGGGGARGGGGGGGGRGGGGGGRR